ncbi:MAG: hypothetical protein N3C12_08475 [Candidatus Binatia bacterium]|nr:hypothetical protein [Candidatus Binatia bacterium]
MRTVKWNVFLSGLCAWAVLGVGASGVRADVTSEKTASILVFPKVVANQNTDTVIMLVNASNSLIQVHCNYVDARLFDIVTGEECERQSATCRPLWQETDFDLWLTRQQPTHWSVARGRRVDPTDGFNADGSGFDPGHIPPKPDFEGELKCVEVSASGEPVTGNRLRGQAVLASANGDLARYNAIGIEGNPDVSPTNPLVLDGDMYAACPEKLWLNHPAEGFNGARTELTLVPCSQDLENQVPRSVTLQFLVYNQFEERFSASTTVTCYLNTQLSDIDAPTNPVTSVFHRNVLGTDVAMTEITPVIQTDGTSGGVIGVAQVFGGTRSGAYSLHTTGSFVPPAGPDTIFLAPRE